MRDDYRVRIRRDWNRDLIVTVRKGWRRIGRVDTLRKPSADAYAHAEGVADEIIRNHADAEVRGVRKGGRYRVDAEKARTAALERHVLDTP